MNLKVGDVVEISGYSERVDGRYTIKKIDTDTVYGEGDTGNFVANKHFVDTYMRKVNTGFEHRDDGDMVKESFDILEDLADEIEKAYDAIDEIQIKLMKLVMCLAKIGLDVDPEDTDIDLSGFLSKKEGRHE